MFVAWHDPVPLEMVAVQREVDPAIKATAPAGGGPAELTVAEYVTGLPAIDEVGAAAIAVAVCSGTYVM